MKIAIIGKGKTGQEVSKLLPATEISEIFDSKNPITSEKLNKADVAIIFIPGEEFLKLIPILLESNTPLVIGSTGMELPLHLDRDLKDKKLSWITAQNFSLGIQYMRVMLKSLEPFKEEFSEASATLFDIHHIHKKDAPSGTAKLLKMHSPFDLSIVSERTGDVVGTHSISLKLPFETITLTHEAHSRQIFAEGAINIARKWVSRPLGYGLFTLEKYFDQREIL